MGGVVAWEQAGILFETYRYDPGPKNVAAAHVHEDYVWCLSRDFPGYYDYLGARHAVPVSSVSVIHPFEPHATGDPFDRETVSTFHVANVPVTLVLSAAESLGRPAKSTPFFSEVVSMDARVRAAFCGLVRASTAVTDRLAFDAALLELVRGSMATMADVTVAEERDGRNHRGVRAAREYLHAHVADPVPLLELADAAGLSSRTLYRSFTADVGVPPHRYQLQLRVDRAKSRLACGERIADVAVSSGFVDQSHLHRQFKRYVGFSPGRYRSGRNIQDRGGRSG